MESKRVEYIDIAKGIGIILVVWGHVAWYGTTIINYFHMGLFFFISGYVLNLNRNSKQYAMSKLKYLYMPYVISQILFILSNNYFYKLGIVEDSYKAIDKIKNIFFALGLSYSHKWLIPTWFLVCMLIVSLEVFFAHKIFTNFNQKVAVLISVILWFVGMILVMNGYNIEIVNFCWANIIISPFYMELGIFLKQERTKFDNIFLAIICAVLLCVSFKCFDLFYTYRDCNQNNIILAFICSVAGIYLILFISTLITEKIVFAKNIFSYIGKRTLWILSGHMISMKMIDYIKCLYSKSSNELLLNFENHKGIEGVGYIIVGGGTPLLIEFIYKHLKIKWNYMYKRAKKSIKSDN